MNHVFLFVNFQLKILKMDKRKEKLSWEMPFFIWPIKILTTKFIFKRNGHYLHHMFQILSVEQQFRKEVKFFRNNLKMKKFDWLIIDIKSSKKRKGGLEKEIRFQLRERVDLWLWDDHKIKNRFVFISIFHGQWRLCNIWKATCIFPWFFLLNARCIRNNEETKYILRYSYNYLFI